MSKNWNVVETKARLSEVLKKAARKPQIIENRGIPVAVILGYEEYTALTRQAGQIATLTPMQRLLKLSESLRQDDHATELVLPPRRDRQSPVF